MPPTAFLAAPKPVSLHAILDVNNFQSPTPNIDLEWEPFQAHVEAFLNAIDKYTLDAKTEIAARASDHIALVRDMKADKDETERRIQLEREKEGEMLATLEQERHTLQDLTSSLSHLQTTLSKVKDQSATLESELNSVKKEVSTERAEKERQRRKLEEMQEQDEIELGGLEEVLGWRIEGIRENILLMRFTLIDPSDPEREFSLVIDVSKQDYSVPRCEPPLASLPDMLQQLNTDRDLYGFIKRARKAFRALVPSQSGSTKFDDMSGPGHY
ncbi:putative kinetochore protein SPC25 [Naematelia encephala]|uniref:Kinetochore protein SPC25 n=1 Tax=Naematelia encephala TaxID=71784 RepID=A0A1Y2BLB7_9TREE|nr:putative kinetochore protein SPC25 [Naematelia encephala]